MADARKSIDDAAIEAAFINAMKARQLANAAHRETGASSGTVECPACSAQLRWTKHPRNGHVHAQCTRTGCISFIE